MYSKYTSLCACSPNVVILFEGSVGVHHSFLFTCLPTYHLELLGLISAWRVRVKGVWRALSQTSSQGAAWVCTWSSAVLQSSTVQMWLKKNKCAYTERPGKQNFSRKVMAMSAGDKAHSMIWSVQTGKAPGSTECLQSGCNHLLTPKDFCIFGSSAGNSKSGAIGVIYAENTTVFISLR